MAIQTVPIGAKICPPCRGIGILGQAPRAQVCPMCDGAGVLQPDPIRVPYHYVMPNAVLTSLQAGLPITQQLDQDSDFECIFYIANSTGLFSFQITDQSTGRAFSNVAVNGENGSGTGQLPVVLVEPYVWARSSVFRLIFNDRSAAGNTVQWVFWGYKLFPRGNPAQGSQGAIVQA